MGSTAVVTSNAIVPEFLSYENYWRWSLWVKTYLLAENLWDVVNPSTASSSPQPEEGEKFKDWTRKNAKALYVIQNSCGTDMLSAIDTTETAKDAWEALETVCKAKQKAKKDLEELEYYVSSDNWVKAEECLIKLPDAVRIRDPRSEHGETALFVAAWKGHLQVVKELMSFMTQEDLQMKTLLKGLTPLHGAVISGHLDIVELLAAVMGQVKSLSGNTALHTAARYGHMHIVRGLISFMTQEDIKMKNNEGNTALHRAWNFGQMDVVKELVPLMGEITNNYGDTILHRAVKTGDARIVKEMVNLMKREDLEIRNNDGYTALDLAVKYEDGPILRELVSYDDDDRYLLFIDYVIKGDWVNANECLEKLGPYTYDAIRAIDPRDGCANTVLHIAVKQGHVNIVKELVSLMTQEMLEEKEADGLCEETIIERAKKIIQQHERMLSRVLEQRNAFGDTALHLAIRKENVHIVKVLGMFMRKEGFELRNNQGSTALHEAVSKESVDIVNELVLFMSQLQAGFEVKNEAGYTALHLAVLKQNVEIVKELVRVMRQESLEVKDAKGSNALHLASKARNMQISIVKYLVSAMRPEALELKDRSDNTALGCALNAGQNDENVKEMVKHIAEKNNNVFVHKVLDEYDDDNLPLNWLFMWDKHELGRHLYSVTPHEALNGYDGIWLIAICIRGMMHLDIALHLLQRYPNLIFDDVKSLNLMLELAQMRITFCNGTTLTLCQKLIYNGIHVQQHVGLNIRDICIDVSDTGDDQSKKNVIFSGINRISEMKSNHLQVNKLLECMANTIKAAGELSEEKLNFVRRAIFKATERGNVEFVKHIFEAVPESEEFEDEQEKSIFHFAVECRQENIYNLLHRLNKEKRHKILQTADKTLHNILHCAGKLSPVARLNHIQGASLQMQRELHWFKEVESIAPLLCRELRTKDGVVEGLTPGELFTKNHKDLMEEAEKSIKDTASSCTVVGSLIATMMFTAAFTVPGGNNGNTGIPMFVESDLFLAFMISDTLSLVSSTTSVIIFLGLLTSRFAENDYLVSLPKKMMLGLFTLFLSVASMMMAFSCALIIMLHGKYSWIVAPTIVLGSVPIAAFVWMQFPLLVNTFISTYGSGIFKKETQPWYKTLMGFGTSQRNKSVQEEDSDLCEEPRLKLCQSI